MQKNIKTIFVVVFFIKLFVFRKPTIIYRGENAADEFIKQFLKNINIVKK